MSFIAQVFLGIGTGLFAAAVGFIKAYPNGEQIVWTKLIPPMVIGAVVGGIVAYNGQSLDSIAELIASSGVVALANQLYVALIKIYANTKSGKTVNGKLKIKRK